MRSYVKSSSMHIIYCLFPRPVFNSIQTTFSCFHYNGLIRSHFYWSVTHPRSVEANVLVFSLTQGLCVVKTPEGMFFTSCKTFILKSLHLFKIARDLFKHAVFPFYKKGLCSLHSCCRINVGLIFLFRLLTYNKQELFYLFLCPSCLNLF